MKSPTQVLNTTRKRRQPEPPSVLQPRHHTFVNFEKIIKVKAGCHSPSNNRTLDGGGDNLVNGRVVLFDSEPVPQNKTTVIQLQLSTLLEEEPAKYDKAVQLSNQLAEVKFLHSKTVATSAKF